MIEYAIEAAKQSSSESHRVGCIITDRKGNIISSGFNNETKSHPMQLKFASLVGMPEKMFLHAEIHALVRCNGTPHTIYVARITKGDNIGMAKPCPICELAIKESGATKVVYTYVDNITAEYNV